MKYMVRKGFVYRMKGKVYSAGDIVEIEEGQKVSHQLAQVKEAAEKVVSKPKRSSKRRKTAAVEAAEAGE